MPMRQILVISMILTLFAGSAHGSANSPGPFGRGMSFKAGIQERNERKKRKALERAELKAARQREAERKRRERQQREFEERQRRMEERRLENERREREEFRRKWEEASRKAREEAERARREKEQKDRESQEAAKSMPFMPWQDLMGLQSDRNLSWPMGREFIDYKLFAERHGRDGGDGAGSFGGYSSGNGSYLGAKCNLPNLDYAKFPREWGAALVQRMAGDDHQVMVIPRRGKSPLRITGRLDLAAEAQALASDIGCPRFDRSDTETAAYLVAATVIAIACPESGWDPTETYDERNLGGVTDFSDVEGNESRGLLQMTRKSDRDSSRGCIIERQSDLDNPELNLMCGLAKIDKMNYRGLYSYRSYWSVAKKLNGSIKAAVRRECNSGYPHIKAYVNPGLAPETDHARSPAATAPAPVPAPAPDPVEPVDPHMFADDLLLERDEPQGTD